jgi:hypothetical protein
MGYLKEDRSWFLVMFYSVITLGIYAIYFLHVQIRDTNIACAKDGKHTPGMFKLIFLSMITFGIYSIVWNIKLYSRWQHLAESVSEKPRYTITAHILLTIVFSSSGITTLIASILQVSAFNQICAIYNDRYIPSEEEKQKNNPSKDLWGWKSSKSVKELDNNKGNEKKVK